MSRRASTLSARAALQIDVSISDAVLGPLTPVEREVARLAAEDLSSIEIAERRGTTTKTVANQLGQIYAKLHVHSRFSLASLLARR